MGIPSSLRALPRWLASGIVAPLAWPAGLVLLCSCMAPLQVTAERDPPAPPAPPPTATVVAPPPSAASPAASVVAEPEPTPAAPPAPVELIHVVEPGENLTWIARRYDVRVRDLVRENGIRDADLIRPKAELRVVLVPPPGPPAAGAPDAPAADVAAGGPRPPRPDPPAPRVEAAAPPAARSGAADALVRRAEAELRSAYYERAIATAEDALALLDAAGGDRRGDRRRAQLELVAGTAELALGNQRAALARFARALDANPRLRPDPLETSPKVLRILEAARAGSAPPAE